ncbi:MAG: tetratricopeptide repeat protein [Xenococcaceae cyanobacterium MO_167.B27]|nr:tetratricopeptide repeat protein [Xenococcaceae cyanobacterium MO_167.B27]
MLFIKFSCVAAYQPSVLIRIQNDYGDLLYKSNNQSEYVRASEDMELYPDYWLQQSAGGASKIRCAKDSPLSQDVYKLVAEGEHSFANLGCPLIARTISPKIITRGGEKSNIPFIISPRSTAILNDRPTLRWNAVAGVTNYTVSLEDQRIGKGNLWTTEVSESGQEYFNQPSASSSMRYIEVNYPVDAPSLEIGVDYLAIVTTKQQVKPTDKCPEAWAKQPDDSSYCITSSTQDEGKGLGFYLLEANQAQQIQKLADNIKQELEGTAQALALAHLYQENNLMMDAIMTLENLVEQRSQTTGVYRFLGDLYQGVQLNKLAEVRYTKAIELAENSDDLVGQATAKFGLAEVLAARGSNQKAIQIGQEAKDAYATLGDTAKVKKLQEKLSQWE